MKKPIILLLLLTLNVIASGSEGKKSIAQLRKECGNELYHLNYRHVDSLSTILMQRSEADGDKRMIAYANFYKGASQMMLGKGAIAQISLVKAREMTMEVGDDTLTALVLNSLAIYEGSVNANMYVAQRYFLESLRYAEKSHYETIKGGIYGNLSEVAILLKDTTGIKYSMMCLEMGQRQNNANLTYMGMIHTAEFLHLMEHNKEALKYVDNAISLCTEHKFHDISVLYVLKAAIFCDMNRLNEAGHYCQMAIDILPEEQPTQLPKAYLQYANVKYKLKEYDHSLRLLEKAVEESERNNTFNSIVEIYELMAHNHEALGQTELALKYLKQARDSANMVDTQAKQHLMNERNLVVDMIEKEKEIGLREAQMLTMRRTMVGLAAVVALLVCLLYVSIRGYRRRTQLYHNIVQQNKQALEREKMLKQRIKQLQEDTKSITTGNHESVKEVSNQTIISQNDPTANPQAPKLDELWQRLQTLMEQDRVYADNQMDREKLAQMLGTNRTYLTTLISDRTGMSYTKYINSYRIREAVAILSDKQQADYPLKSICTDLGFGSMSHFHKLFRENVGMSPSVYRESAIRI